MAPAESPLKATLSAAAKDKVDGPKPSKATTKYALRPASQHVSPDSSLPLLPPLTKEARRLITIGTKYLMQKRDKLDKVLLRQTGRTLENLQTTDWLPREDLLRQCERLAMRERRYIRTIKRAIKERTILYERDPSAERAADLDLVRKLLTRFKRHLGPYLADTKQPKGNGDGDSNTAAISRSNGKGVGAAVASSSPSGPSGDDKTSEHRKPPVAAGLDGAFDDTIAAKKRKADGLIGSEKESQKKARKEQPDSRKESSTLEGQSGEPIAPQRPQGMENHIAQIKAEINNVSQTKTTKTAERVSDKKEKADLKAKETATVKTPRDDGSLIPFYKIHAKAMMQPDFNDHVHDRPQRRKGNNNKPIKRYDVCGALDASRYLPSPKPIKEQKRGGKPRPSKRRP